jgi:hypothetical protein
MVIGQILSRCFFVLAIFFHTYSWAIIYGSTTTVAVYPQVTFPVTDSNNTMLGFGSFASGFILQNSATTCLFNSINPVSGNIELNGGTLTLNQDLVLTNTNVITGGGQINGNNYSIRLNELSQFEANQTFTLQNVVLELGADFNLGCTLIFQGNSYITGNNFPLWLNEPYNNLGAGIILVASNSWLYFDNTYLQNLVGSNIACVDDTGVIVLRDTTWNQSGNFIFRWGSLNFYHAVAMMGPNLTFAYQSGMSSTILYQSTLTLDQGFTFSYDLQESSYPGQILFEDATSILALNSATLYTTVTGFSLTAGTIDVLQSSTLVIQSAISTWTNGGVTLGDNANVINDMTLVISPGQTLTVLGGTLYYSNLNQSLLQFQNVSATIYIGPTATLQLNQTMNLGVGILTFANGATLALALATNAIIMGSIQPLGQYNITYV